MNLTKCFKGVQIDFEMFAFYQCALCSKKHSKLKSLKEHVENHLRSDTFFHIDGETFVVLNEASQDGVEKTSEIPRKILVEKNSENVMADKEIPQDEFEARA